MAKKKYSAEIEQQIEYLYITGNTIKEIHQKLDVSVGFIQNVLDKLYERLGKRDVQAINEFFKSLKELDVTNPKQVALGVHVYSILQKNDLDDETFVQLLKETIKKCATLEITPKTLIEYCKKLTALQEKSDVPIESLFDLVEELAAKKDELEVDVNSLLEQKNDIKISLDKIRHEKQTVIEKITKIEEIQKGLEKFKISLEAPATLNILLNGAAVSGFDTDKIIQHIQREESYESQIQRLGQKLQDLTNQETGLIATLKRLTAKINAKKELVEQLDYLAEFGVLDEHLELLLQKVEEIATTNNISKKDAFERLVDNLDKFDNMVGFEICLTEQKDEIHKNSEKLESINIKIENSSLKYKDTQAAIDAIKSLGKKGVDPNRITAINNLFAAHGEDPNSFEEQLKKVLDLKRLEKTEQEKLKQTQKLHNQLDAKNNWLESNIEKLESVLLCADKHIEKRLNSHLEKSKEEIFDTASDAKIKINDIHEAALQKLSEVETRTTDLLHKRFSELDEWIKKSLMASLEAGRLEWMMSFYDFVFGKKFDRTENLTIMIKAIERLDDEHKKQSFGSRTFSLHLKQFREELYRALTRKDD